MQFVLIMLYVVFMDTKMWLLDFSVTGTMIF